MQSARNKILLAMMGVLAHRLRKVTKPLRSHIQSFGTLGQLFKLPLLSAQICHSAGGKGGSPTLFLDWNPNIYVT